MIQLSLKELIIVHINYRDIFNSPTLKNDLEIWVGAQSSVDRKIEFDNIINTLKEEHLITEIQDYLVVYGKDDIIFKQKEKNVLAQKLIRKGNRILNLCGKIPFVKFIGVSGSIAANNPILDKKGHVDLDLFVISAKNALWIIFLFERLITNLIKLFTGKHFYCFNYVTDESFLEIYNKNFFTATELANLIPIIDKGVYTAFVERNSTWFSSFYAEKSLKYRSQVMHKTNALLVVLIPLNYLCFVIFCLSRGLKRRSLKCVLECIGSFNPKQAYNLKRISSPNGGYQELIKSRFEYLLRSNFSVYYSQRLIKLLFPEDVLSYNSEKVNPDALIALEKFKKYHLVQHEKSTV